MAFKPEQEVPPENIEIGRPVQESSCVKTRPWPSSDKQSHNHPGAVDTLGTNSKPVFAHDEGLAVCEMTEYAEGVEEGKMEKKAEEKVAEAELGVLPGMSGSCLSQEAEPQSPTMDEHKPRPDGSTAEGHIKVTDRIAGQKKVFRKRQKAKPKMQMAEAAGTEGGPRNTRAPFRLQDFMCSKISKYTVLFLLMLLESTVYSSETPKPGMCALCLDKDCATGVRRIYPADGAILVWPKANSPTGIQNCSMENLKPDAPCKMANGSLVQLADNPLDFEGIDTYGVRRPFHSQISPCADLINSKPSPGMCAVCLDEDCTTGVSEIYPPDSDTAIWSKANSRTGIQTCSMENLKADAPCKMANGSLVQLADETLRFEGTIPPNIRRIFHSQSFPCADLINSKPSPVTKAPNIPVVDNKDSGSGSGSRIGIGGGIGIFGIVILILILIGVLIWKKNIIFRLRKCLRGLYRGRRQGNNRVPPDVEYFDEQPRDAGLLG